MPELQDTQSSRSSENSQSYVEVSQLLGEELHDLQLEILSGESHLRNRITHPRVQKPGLAFAGHLPYIKPGRVQIVGESEIEYLLTVEAGDMLYVPPRETHTVRNLSDTEPAEYVVARDSPTEDSVEVPWADM